MLARRRLPGRSPDLRSPRWYWTISVSSALWLEPARCERRPSSRSRAAFIACRRSVRLANVLLFIPPTLSLPHKGGGKPLPSSNFRKATRLQGRDGGRARAEHGDLQLPLEAVEQPAHRLLAFGGGGQHRVREPGQVGAHGDRLGGVEPVFQATAGNQRQLGSGAVGRDQRLRRRDAPL